MVGCGWLAPLFPRYHKWVKRQGKAKPFVSADTREQLVGERERARVARGLKRGPEFEVHSRVSIGGQ